VLLGGRGEKAPDRCFCQSAAFTISARVAPLSGPISSRIFAPLLSVRGVLPWPGWVWLPLFGLGAPKAILRAGPVRYTLQMTGPDSDLRMEADSALIEAALHELFDRARRDPEASPEPLDIRFSSACHTVQCAMSDAVFSGGKRIRPLLALRVARLLSTDIEQALKAAASVELLHCASLVIDDLPCMDNALVRRGGAALHTRFGEPRAILAAVSLVALAANSVVADARDPAQLPGLIAFQRRLLQVLDCNSLVGGQAWDLEMGEHERREKAGLLASRKTAPLFELAVLAGALSAAVSSDYVQRLIHFARALALLFQSVDDLMDRGAVQNGSLRHQFRDVQSQLDRLGPGGEELREFVDHLTRQWAAVLEKADVFQ
jgi:geranylgeranyl pyrophosphate synthase